MRDQVSTAAANAQAAVNNQKTKNTATPQSRPQSAILSRQTTQRTATSRIGPYILGKTLGVGSTGRVKLGTHLETGLKVAIKIISRDKLANDEEKKEAMNKKLEREITIMKLIQHPNVLQLYDVYETEKELYLVLEHVEGGELFDYIVARGRLAEPEALNFFQQIIYGVEYSHRHLIFHRDLKPENLLLDKDLNIKIADFGMANLQNPGKLLETSCGSPHYASPEIIKGIKYDGAPADIWSCGVILFALLTGNLPFDDKNIRTLLAKVKSGVFTIPDYVQAGPKDLIKKMLVVDPAKRISMEGILTHPWFTSQKPKHGGDHLSGPMDQQEYWKPLPDVSHIDMEIVNSLELLGWTNFEELKKSLTLEGKSMEKVFYNLLSKRKMEMIENFNMSKRNSWDIMGGPRRRTESFSSLFNSKPDLHEPNSPVFESKRNTEDFGRRPVESQRTSMIATEVLESLTLRETQRNDTEPVKADEQTIGTPQFHRQNQNIAQRPETPVSSAPTSPKKTWFENIFAFKPESIKTTRQESPDLITNRIEKALQNLNVEYQRLDNGFKCRCEDNSKVAKFKVVINQQNIEFIQQQGSFTVFKNVVEKLQELF